MLTRLVVWAHLYLNMQWNVHEGWEAGLEARTQAPEGGGVGKPQRAVYQLQSQLPKGHSYITCSELWEGRSFATFALCPILGAWNVAGAWDVGEV